MSALPGIGVVELVIVSGATGLACSLPVIGALILAVVVLDKKTARRVEPEIRIE